jgi:hypothetical protein
MTSLPFESTETFYIDDWLCFRVGTCHGLWRSTDDAYEILAIKNNKQGNGHFDETLQWFESSCRRDGKKLRLYELWNKQLERHLIEKRGFVLKGEFVEKVY